MKCYKCGSLINVNDETCKVCNTKNLSPYFEKYKYKEHLIFGILEAVCCNQLFGIGAILLNEFKVKPAIISENFEEAEKYKKITLGLLIGGLVIGILIVLLNFGLGILSAIIEEM